MFHGYPYTDFHELNLDEWIAKVKEHTDQISDIYKQIEKPQQEWERLQEEIDAMQIEIDKLKAGDYLDVFIPQILQAVDDALPELIGRLMNLFIFGLTKDGYFTAMYPDSLANIAFDTIADPESDLYGHLVLQF